MTMMVNRITSEQKSFEPDMDVREWEPIQEPIKVEPKLTIQKFSERDEARKVWYYSFFPWERPVRSTKLIKDVY